jgi:homogentisate solanesyltransferase
MWNLYQRRLMIEKEGYAPAFKCDLADSEIVYKIAQVFFPGLATACSEDLLL